MHRWTEKENDFIRKNPDMHYRQMWQYLRAESPDITESMLRCHRKWLTVRDKALDELAV